MALVCVNHPALEAESVCMQCGASICDACKTRVNNRPACPTCAGVAVPEVAVPEPPAPLEFSASAPPTLAAHGAPDLDATPYYAQPSTVLTMNDIVRGLAFGLGVALLGTLIWEKIDFYTSRQFFYLNMITGVLTGAAVVAGTKKHGIIPAVLGGSSAIIAMIFGHWLLIYDVFAGLAAAEGRHLSFFAIPLDSALRACTVFGAMHWIGVTLCIVFAAWVPFKQGKRR